MPGPSCGLPAKTLMSVPSWRATRRAAEFLGLSAHTWARITSVPLGALPLSPSAKPRVCSSFITRLAAPVLLPAL